MLKVHKYYYKIMEMITLLVFQSFLSYSQRLYNPTFSEHLDCGPKIHSQMENKAVLRKFPSQCRPAGKDHRLLGKGHETLPSLFSFVSFMGKRKKKIPVVCKGKDNFKSIKLI